MPPNLTHLDLCFNTFTGTIKFSNFPATLQVIDLGYNKFEGGVDLGSLPAHLNKLNLSGNQFSGTINIFDLPKCLVSLSLNANEFTGYTRIHPRTTHSSHDPPYQDLDFSALPASMEYFEVACNRLTGKLHLEGLPSSIKKADFSNNQFFYIEPFYIVQSILH